MLQRIIFQNVNALERMRLGLELIQTDQKIRKAFQLANQAIYNQQILPSYKRKLIKYDSNAENPDDTFIFEKSLEEYTSQIHPSLALVWNKDWKEP